VGSRQCLEQAGIQVTYFQDIFNEQQSWQIIVIVFPKIFFLVLIITLWLLIGAALRIKFDLDEKKNLDQGKKFSTDYA